MFKFIAPLSTALLIGLAVQAQSTLPQAKDLVGHWVSAAPENYGQFFATREFVLTERAWNIAFRAYADSNATQALWTLRVDGHYRLGAAHKTEAGARDANFYATKKYITAYNADLLKVFAGDRNWNLGTEYDFSRTGAGFFEKVIPEPELDLVKLENNQLFLGDRSIDLIKQRALKASAYPLVRK